MLIHTSYLSRVHGSYPWRKICHVEKFQISIHLSWGEIWNFSPLIMWRQSRFLHITDVDKFEISLHMSCGDNSDFSTSVIWRNLKFLSIYHVEEIQISPQHRCREIRNVSTSVMCLIFVICNFMQYAIFAIYAVLSQNLFCRDLRVYAWRKIEPKIVPVEKK